MDIVNKAAGYIGAGIAIILGVISRTTPPILDLERDFSIALIVGGLAAVGVTVGIPAVRNAALREAEAVRTATAPRRRTRAVAAPTLGETKAPLQ